MFSKSQSIEKFWADLRKCLIHPHRRRFVPNIHTLLSNVLIILYPYSHQEKRTTVAYISLINGNLLSLRDKYGVRIESAGITACLVLTRDVLYKSGDINVGTLDAMIPCLGINGTIFFIIQCSRFSSGLNSI